GLMPATLPPAPHSSLFPYTTLFRSRKPWIESFALPDPSRYAARALAASLMKKGVSVEGGTAGTTDSLAYGTGRGCCAPLVEYRGRPLTDIIFPILNSSQNWFAEMLLKILGREQKGEGSWRAGLEVERRFLIDSVGIDSTAFALEDGSGLAAGNLVTPHAFTQLLAYMHRHPKRAPFLAALPPSRDAFQSSDWPKMAILDECPGSIFAAGLMKCTAWFTAIAASDAPVAMSLSFPG